MLCQPRKTQLTNRNGDARAFDFNLHHFIITYSVIFDFLIFNCSIPYSLDSIFCVFFVFYQISFIEIKKKLLFDELK